MIRVLGDAGESKEGSSKLIVRGVFHIVKLIAVRFLQKSSISSLSKGDKARYLIFVAVSMQVGHLHINFHASYLTCMKDCRSG